MTQDPSPDSPAVEAALEALRDDELEQFLAAEEATAAAAKSASKDQWKAYVAGTVSVLGGDLTGALSRLANVRSRLDC